MAKRAHPWRLWFVQVLFLGVVVLGVAEYFRGGEDVGWWVVPIGVGTAAVFTALHIWAYKGGDSEKANPS